MSESRPDSLLERGMFAFLVATLLFGPLATGAVRPEGFAWDQLLMACALILWVLRLWTDRDHRLFWVPACWGVLAFVGYALLRTSQVDIRMLGRNELGRVIVYAACFLVVLHSARSDERWRTLVYALAILGTLISAYAVFQFATGSNRVWAFVRPPDYAGRGSGTYICPNHLAGFLAMVLPLTSALVIGGRTPILGRLLLGYSALMMVAGLGVSLSRGGWIAAGAGLFALVLIHAWIGHRSWQAWALLAAASALACILASQSLSVRQRAKKLTTGWVFGNSIEVRLAMWQAATEMWQDHFWWGAGPGHFDYRFPAYRPAIVQQRPGYAHNDYLNTLADWGSTGMLLVALTGGLTLAGAARGLRQISKRRSGESLRSSNRLTRLSGACAGLVAVLVHSLFDFNMQIPANALLAVTLLALINSEVRFTTSRFWIRPNLAVRLALGLACLAAAGWLARQGWHAARAGHYLSIANRENRQTPARLEALTRAAEIDPLNADTSYALGDAYRQLSFQGAQDYADQASQAIHWLGLSTAANPLDPYAPVRIGMCLDWLDKHEEAVPYYERALALDPRNHHLCILRGWHHLQTAEYLEATRWFRRSLQLKHWPNPTARQFFYRAQRLLKQQRDAETGPARRTPQPSP